MGTGLVPALPSFLVLFRFKTAAACPAHPNRPDQSAHSMSCVAPPAMRLHSSSLRGLHLYATTVKWRTTAISYDKHSRRRHGRRHRFWVSAAPMHMYAVHKMKIKEGRARGRATAIEPLVSATRSWAPYNGFLPLLSFRAKRHQAGETLSSQAPVTSPWSKLIRKPGSHLNNQAVLYVQSVVTAKGHSSRQTTSTPTSTQPNPTRDTGYTTRL